ADVAAAWLPATQLLHSLHHRVDIPPLPAVESVLRIAVLTPQRTARETHEYGRDPRSVSLALQGIEDLGDLEARHLRPSLRRELLQPLLRPRGGVRGGKSADDLAQ